MKIKMLIPVALTLCLAFALCACGTTANTNETSTAPATTLAAEATTTAVETTAETETTASTAEFTEEDALELVKNTYDFDDEYFLQSRGTAEVDGVSYYAVDLRKSLEANVTYLSTYFVTLDGSEILLGYFEGDTPVISETEATLDITEENAVKAVEAAYDFEDGYFLTLRGTEEIDGVSYYAVDLRKSLESNVTYISTYFVTAEGTIIEGYYEGNTPILAE